MKKDILKIAGVKSEKEFYYLYPTEEAFKKAFPKEFKKAAMGASMVKKQLTQLTDFANPPQAQVGTYMGGNTSMYKPVNYANMYDDADYATTGMNREMRMQDKNLAAQQAQAANAGNKGGFDLMQAAGNLSQIADSMRQGGYIPRGQNGLISMPDFTKADKTINRQFKYDNSKFGQGMNKLGKDIGQGYDKLDSNLSDVGGVSGALGIGQDLLGGFQELKREKDIQKQAHQFNRLSGLTNQVAGLTPDISARKYVRPEDMQMDPNQFAQSNGSSPNNPYLQMQEGGNVGGNPTELQNMYTNGNTLYSNLGFEPLNDSDVIKQYRRGGHIPRAQFGIDKMAGQAGGALGSLIGGGKGRPTAGGTIGSTVGSTIGKFVPIPGASAILGGVGGLVGGIFGGQSAKKTEDWQTQGEQNMQNAAFMQGTRAMQAQNSAYMEDGGWVSHDWQPQVITKFGDYNVSDLLREDPTMDTLRSGGHLRNYTPPSARAMSTERPDFAMGGQLKTTWGGYAEPISQNPYLPGSGETVMFRGKSHEESDGNGHTGIGVKYGKGAQDSYTDYAQYGTEQADADVEVERGEPATEMPDSETGETSMIVYGNMKIPSYGVSELKDPKAKGKKFKNYANDLSKMEKKKSTLLQKSIERLNSLNPTTPFEKLEFDTLAKIVDGANMDLKGLASQKQLLAGLQNSILDTAEEFGVESDALAKGKIKQNKNQDMAKFGGKFTKAQSGAQRFPSPVDSRGEYYMPGYEPYQTDGTYTNLPEITIRANRANKERVGQIPMNGNFTSPTPPEMNVTLPTYASSMKSVNEGSGAGTSGNGYKFDLANVLRQVQPYLIPSNQEPIDPNQFAAEMFDLSTNVPMGVQAQQISPQLETPYSVSFQDQLNANQADFNAMQRQYGANPAAASQLAAQKYAANSGVLGQQFRANQEMQMGAFNRNRGILNDTTIKNMEILDRQYGRQQQGLSNTKAQAHAALASISDKIAKHKLENRTLGIYENLYNFRFGPKGRAQNVNAPVDWNMDGNPFARTNNASGQLEEGYEDLFNAAGRRIATRKSSKDNEPARNGRIVKSIKNL